MSDSGVSLNWDDPTTSLLGDGMLEDGSNGLPGGASQTPDFMDGIAQTYGLPQSADMPQQPYTSKPLDQANLGDAAWQQLRQNLAQPQNNPGVDQNSPLLASIYPRATLGSSPLQPINTDPTTEIPTSGSASSGSTHSAIASGLSNAANDAWNAVSGRNVDNSDIENTLRQPPYNMNDKDLEELRSKAIDEVTSQTSLVESGLHLLGHLFPLAELPAITKSAADVARMPEDINSTYRNALQSVIDNDYNRHGDESAKQSGEAIPLGNDVYYSGPMAPF